MSIDTNCYTNLDTIIFGVRGKPAVRVSRGGDGPRRRGSPRHSAGRSGRFLTRSRSRFVVRSGLLLAALAVLVVRPARGDTMGYSVQISSSLALLESPDDPNLKIEVAGANAHQNWVQNNNPVIEITNDSMTADISNVSLAIQNTPDIISALKVISPNGAVPEGSFANNIYGGPATSIDISLAAAPLAPGKSLIFSLQLGPATSYSDPNWVPGYMNVFYNTADPSKNALFTVTYDPPGDPATTSSETLPAVDSSDVTMLAAVTNCAGNATIVTSTPMGGGTGPSVPEPSSMALVVLGGIPIGWFAWRQRRRRLLPAVA